MNIINILKKRAIWFKKQFERLSGLSNFQERKMFYFSKCSNWWKKRYLIFPAHHYFGMGRIKRILCITIKKGIPL
jgi:hypothetical protein